MRKIQYQIGHKLKLREFRQRKGLSQYKIAEILKVPRSTYASWEYGHTTPNVYIAIKLARVLGTTVEELFPLENDAEDK